MITEEALIQIIHNKLFWIICGVVWLIISEIIYYLSCKDNGFKDDNGEQIGWFGCKIISFCLGALLMLIIGIIFSLLFLIILAIYYFPLQFLKVFSIIGLIIIFFYINWRIYKKYN